MDEDNQRHIQIIAAILAAGAWSTEGATKARLAESERNKTKPIEKTSIEIRDQLARQTVEFYFNCLEHLKRDADLLD